MFQTYLEVYLLPHIYLKSQEGIQETQVQISPTRNQAGLWARSEDENAQHLSTILNLTMNNSTKTLINLAATLQPFPPLGALKIGKLGEEIKRLNNKNYQDTVL